MMKQTKAPCVFCDKLPRVDGRQACKPCEDAYQKAAPQEPNELVKWVAERVRRYAKAETSKKRKALENLTAGNMQFIARMDELMKAKLTEEKRAKAVGQLLCALEMLNDGVRYHELGVDFRTDRREDKAAVTQEQLTEIMRILGIESTALDNR